MKFFVAIGLLTATLAGASPWQSLTALAVSPDGRFLATGGLSGEVLYWEASTGEVLIRWEAKNLPVVGVEFDTQGLLGVELLDGSRFVADRAENKLRAITQADARWKTLAASLNRWQTQGGANGIRADRGSIHAEGFSNGQVEVTQSGGSGMVSWKAHDAAVTGLVWGPDGKILYSCSYDGGLAQWDPTTGILLGRL